MAEVRYIVEDVAKATEFCTRFFGFAVKTQMGAAFASVSRGDLTVWLSGPKSSAARPMPDGRQPAPGGWNRFVIQVEDIAATVAAMKAAGVKFRNDIVTGPGGRQIVAEDPSGNPVELFQPA